MRDLSSEAMRLALRRPGMTVPQFCGKLQRKSSEERMEVARAVLGLLNAKKLLVDKARRVFPNADEKHAEKKSEVSA